MSTEGTGVEGERVGTVFVLKEKEEFCFLFDRDDPGRLHDALQECADRASPGLSRQEVMEIIEGMVPNSLRSI